MNSRGIPDGWYWSPGWAKIHYVFAGNRTCCGHAARNLTTASGLSYPECMSCAGSRAAKTRNAVTAAARDRRDDLGGLGT